MTLTRLEPITSCLKSKLLINSTKENLCTYCSFKIYFDNTQQIDTVTLEFFTLRRRNETVARDTVCAFRGYF